MQSKKKKKTQTSHLFRCRAEFVSLSSACASAVRVQSGFVLRCALRQRAFAVALPPRLIARASVRLVLFSQSAMAQMSSAHGGAAGVRQTHHYTLN